MDGGRLPDRFEIYNDLYSSYYSNNGYPIYQEFEDLLNYEGVSISYDFWTSSVYSEFSENYYYEPSSGSYYDYSSEYDYKYAICVYDGITSISY